MPELTLPPIVSPPATPAPSGGPTFLVREVRLLGNTVLGESELRSIVAPFLGHRLTASDLQTLRQALTVAYVNKGYVNSGAVLPDQQVVDGVVAFQIIEGRLTGIEVTGLERLAPEYVRQRLSLGAGPPLNVANLEARLQLLLQDPLIERMNVELMPGVGPGEAQLRTRVKETDPYSLRAAFGNDQAPSVGEYRGELRGELRGLTGWGDTLSLRYGQSAGLKDGAAAWSVPVTPEDTTVQLRYDANGSTVIEQRFRSLDITSQSRTYEASIRHPIYRTANDTVTLGGALAKRENQTFLLGEPFSFSAGSVDGRTNVAVLRFSQDWIQRSSAQVMALRSTLSRGLNVLDATVGPSKPNGRFFTWLGQGQYARRIFGESELVLRLDAQFSHDPLFSLEQLSLGGANTVRGYRENLLVRDNGYIGSVEGRIPILSFALPWQAQAAEGGVLQLAPFFDYGAGWNKDRPTPSPRNIGSVGLGLRLDLGGRIHAQLYYGKALREVPVSPRSLEDRGIHFRLETSLY
ncbi:MAG: ShlB/FhaC/HecB family hemolysin secretion/activation protein [Proteobacteria bacterium]|nr:ShlB/FhaC/HecB family hemolysin secretion/activation protein [Pseudomonadota bacterium]